METAIVKKIFDFKRFGTDVLIHRAEIGMSRSAYSKEIGCADHILQRLEANESDSPNVTAVYNICQFMDKDINDYFV